MKRICLAVLLFALTGALSNDVIGGPEPRRQKAGPPAAAAGGSDTGGADAMQRELEGMRRSLHEITILLAAALERQELSVFMSRIELKQRRQQPLEAALRSARRERQSLTDEADHLADMLEMLEQDTGENPINAEAMQGEMARARKQQDRLAERVTSLDQRIIELEDDLARNEEDISMLEELIDQRLGLR